MKSQNYELEMYQLRNVLNGMYQMEMYQMGVRKKFPRKKAPSEGTGAVLGLGYA